MTRRLLEVFCLPILCLFSIFVANSAEPAPGAGDGWEVSEPESLDSVRFKHYTKDSVKELTLQEVERLWPDVDRENVLRRMGTIRHAKIVEFLYRAAVIDPTLYKGRAPDGYTFGDMAIVGLVRTGHPSVPEKLQAILKAPMKLIPASEARDIKGRASRQLLQFKGKGRELVFKTLDENVQAGQVFCPYPPPVSFWRNGQWIDPPVEAEGIELLRKWLGHEKAGVRLEAALCMAQSGIDDRRVREFANAAAQEGRSKDERFIAEQILKALAAHGDKRAEKTRDELEMEKELRQRNTGHPDGDKVIREHLENEFQKKWGNESK